MKTLASRLLDALVRAASMESYCPLGLFRVELVWSWTVTNNSKQKSTPDPVEMIAKRSLRYQQKCRRCCCCYGHCYLETPFNGNGIPNAPKRGYCYVDKRQPRVHRDYPLNCPLFFWIVGKPSTEIDPILCDVPPPPSWMRILNRSNSGAGSERVLCTWLRVLVQSGEPLRFQEKPSSLLLLSTDLNDYARGTLAKVVFWQTFTSTRRRQRRWLRWACERECRRDRRKDLRRLRCFTLQWPEHWRKLNEMILECIEFRYDHEGARVAWCVTLFRKFKV